MLVTMSPGLVALPAGMFSQVGTMTTRLIFRPISTTARSVPITEPAPSMSYFISSMLSPGLSEMPPVSNVMPLPTSTTGAALAAAPWYCSTMNWGGSTEPFATDRNEPINGFVPVGSERFSRTAPVHRAAIPGRRGQGRTGRAGRQGHHVRHRRHFAQAGRKHGRDEVRHARRGLGDRHAARGRRNGPED